MYQTLTADSQRQKTKNTCGKILGNIGLFLLVFLAAVPVLWLIYLSLKSNTDILTNPLALPDTLHWENYVNAYKTIPFYSMVKNTGIVILISVPVSMLLSIFAAFALGRMRFGSGRVQSRETLALEIKRRLRTLLKRRGSSKSLLVVANPWLADWLAAKDLRAWERELACTLRIEADASLHCESFMILDNSGVDK